jgi:hypothetical protein
MSGLSSVHDGFPGLEAGRLQDPPLGGGGAGVGVGAGVGPGLGVGAGVGASLGKITGIAIGERVGAGLALGWVGSCSWMAWHPEASSAPGSSRVNGQRPLRMQTSLSLETTSGI